MQDVSRRRGRKGRTDTPPGFPTRLRTLREEKDISRCALSECCGMGHTMIGRYERGEVKPTLDALSKIAKYFGMTTSELIGPEKKM